MMEVDYPICDECIHYEGCHSTIFGECWTCGKNNPNCSDIQDNRWTVEEENGQPIPCKDYEKGEHLLNVVLG